MQRRESNVWRRNGSICTYDAITETRVPAAAMDDDVEVGGELRHHELTCTFYTKWEITLTVPPPSIRAFTNEPYKAMETLSASQSTTSPTLTTPCSFNYFFKLLEITIIMTLMLCALLLRLCYRIRNTKRDHFNPTPMPPAHILHQMYVASCITFYYDYPVHGNVIHFM